jgi:hypothetical protein
MIQTHGASKMSQTTFNDGDLLSIARAAINGNASDVENRVPDMTVFRTAQDIIDATTDEGDSGNARGLPAGRYHLNNSLDVGVLHFVLTELNGFYEITSNAFDSFTYTGTLPFITNDVAATGTALILIDTTFITPNASAISIADGNSLIFKLAVFGGCQSVGTYSGSFFTVRGVAIAACGDGITCNDVDTIQADTFQYSSGLDTGGTGLTLTGSGGICILSGCDSRPEATESFIDVDAGYTGSVSITGGSHNKIGAFFAGARDQSDPDIILSNVVNVKASTTEAFGHVAANATETVIVTQGVPVKLDATWSNLDISRFTFDASGRWTYSGKEDVCIKVELTVTIDPVGGGSRDVSTYIAKNGTFNPNTEGSATLSSGGQITSIGIIDLVTGDFLEPFIENNSGTQNLIGTTCSIVVG